MLPLLDGYELVPLKQDDDVVQKRATAFFARMGVPKPIRPDVVKWVGFVKAGVVSLVVSVFVREDESIEVLDFYPEPTRAGIRAGYAALRLLKALVDFGVIPYWLGNVVWRNETGKRRTERFFKIEPTCALYVYRGNEA